MDKQYLINEMTRALTMGLIEAFGSECFACMMTIKVPLHLATTDVIREGHITVHVQPQIFDNSRFSNHVTIEINTKLVHILQILH